MKALQKKGKILKDTTCNKEYKIALKSDGVECLVCMGRCGDGPLRSNEGKRNCGRRPFYKNINRRSLSLLFRTI